jgi:Jacalin-like lectin domain
MGRGQTAQRIIYDSTDPLSPRRIISKLPNINKYIDGPKPGAVYGRYFDDSGSVIENDAIKSLAFEYDRFAVTGLRMYWRGSGLQSVHGSFQQPSSSSNSLRRSTVEYEMEPDEYIMEVGIGKSSPLLGIGKRRVIRVRIRTSRNQTIVAGYGTSEDTTYGGENIIAFHGQADAGLIYELGVASFRL